MTVWTWLWVGWLLAFAVIEGVAITNDAKDDTLSEHLREWFRTDRKLGRTVWIVFCGCLFSWLAVHIAVAGSI